LKDGEGYVKFVAMWSMVLYTAAKLIVLTVSGAGSALPVMIENGTYGRKPTLNMTTIEAGTIRGTSLRI